MAMNQFNRSNPFVIKMRAINDQIYEDLHSILKRLIVINILFLIFNIIFAIFSAKLITVLIVYLVYIYSLALLIRQILRKSELTKVNEMLSGNEYQSINVNNEAILDIICKYHEVYGKVKSIIYIQIALIVMAMCAYIIILF